MINEQKYINEMLQEMREQFDFDAEEEKGLIEAIRTEYREMNN